MSMLGRPSAGAGELERTEWLYTRGEESVRIDLSPEGSIFSLVVCGPGVERQIRAYPSQETLDLFLAEFEQDLHARGFRLMAIAERRQDIQEPSADTAEPTDRRRNQS